MTILVRYQMTHFSEQRGPSTVSVEVEDDDTVLYIVEKARDFVNGLCEEQGGSLHWFDICRIM